MNHESPTCELTNCLFAFIDSHGLKKHTQVPPPLKPPFCLPPLITTTTSARNAVASAHFAKMDVCFPVFGRRGNPISEVQTSLAGLFFGGRSISAAQPRHCLCDQYANRIASALSGLWEEIFPHPLCLCPQGHRRKGNPTGKKNRREKFAPLCFSGLWNP